MMRSLTLLPLLLLACAPAPARSPTPAQPTAQAVMAAPVPGLLLQLTTPTTLSVRVQNGSSSTLNLIGDTRIENDGAHLTVLGVNLTPRATEANDWNTQCLAVTTRSAVGWTCNLPDLPPASSSTVVFVAANPAQPAGVTDAGLQGHATGGAKVTAFLPSQ